MTPDDSPARAAEIAKGWHGAICAAATARGWHLENLGDLTRVLRLPGTLNHNGAGGPVLVRVLECRPDLRYAPDDFAPHLVPVAESPSPIDAAGLTLRPDAEPPASKLAEALTECSQFRQTWERQRPDLPDQSQSGYDLSLATIAALRGWNDQEIAELRARATTLKERGELVKQADRDEETADHLTIGLVPFASTAHIDRLREQAARKRELGQQALAALADVLKEIAQAEQEQEAVYERMTAP